MKAQIHKIVRNKIPDKIKDKWEECKYFIANNTEKYKFLVLKIIEELNEVTSASETISIYKEIWDLQQVIWDLLDHVKNTEFSEYYQQIDFINTDENIISDQSDFSEWYYSTWKQFSDITSKDDILWIIYELHQKLLSFIKENSFNETEIACYKKEKLEKLGWFDEWIIITDY